MWYEVIKVENNKIVLFYAPSVISNEEATEKKEKSTEEELNPDEEEAELTV